MPQKTRERVVVLVGLTACLLLGTLTLRGGLPLASLLGLGVADILRYWSTPLLAAMATALLLPWGIARRADRRLQAAGAAVSLACLLGGGFVAFLVSGQDGAVFPIAGAVLIGFGYGLMLLLWQTVLAHLPAEEVPRTLLGSLTMEAVAYLLLAVLGRAALLAAFPVCAVLATLLSALDGGAWTADDGSRSFSRVEVAKTSFGKLQDSLVCIAAIVVIGAFARSTALGGLENLNMVNIAESALVAVCSASLLIACQANRVAFGTQSILRLYRIAFPLMATLLLALCLFGAPLSLPVATFVDALVLLASVLMMIVSDAVACECAIPSSCVFGLFAGFMYLVMALTTPLVTLLCLPQNIGTATFFAIAMVVLYVLSMASQSTQNRRRGTGANEAAFEVASESSDISASESPDNLAPEERDAALTVVDVVDMRCEILSQRFQLTPREREVFQLLAKGRDVPSIARQLVISDNTVRMHAKGVYRKLGVHSKQDLLNALETVPLNS